MALLLLLLLAPFFAAMVFVFRSKGANAILPVIYAAGHLFFTAWLTADPGSLSGYFGVDETNIIFLWILSVVFAGVALYNFDFIKKSEAAVLKTTYYSAVLLIFAGAMTAVLMSFNLGLMWIFIEATTLASAYLIYYKAGKNALEAAWKYIFICSIAIAFAFAGIIFLCASIPGVQKPLSFGSLYQAAPFMNHLWLKTAFVLMTVGFGTKAGLAPVHSWLPDAHSEAPSPVSALLSATLLNCAMMAIIRIQKIMILSGLEREAAGYLMFMGLLSVFVAAVYIIRIGNYKRMLAYSSIENMGLIAVGLSLGNGAIPAVFIQAAGHSFSKAAFFLTSGNILKRYDAREISAVSGMMKSDRTTAWLWIGSFVMISAIPPSPLFFSEFKILRVMFAAGLWPQAAALLLLLTAVIYGMSSAVFKMCFGEALVGAEKEKLSPLRYISQTAFIAILTLAGFILAAASI
jgi:hydrogenase-4 component F